MVRHGKRHGHANGSCSRQQRRQLRLQPGLHPPHRAGLGDAVAIRRIEITWPVTNQTTQVFEPEPTASPPVALDLDSSMRIVQGRLRPEVLALRTNDFEELAAEMVANPSGCSCSMHD